MLSPLILEDLVLLDVLLRLSLSLRVVVVCAGVDDPLFVELRPHVVHVLRRQTEGR